MKTRLLAAVLLMWAVPAIAQDHTALVAAVKADVVARGIDISGPCGAFQITGRVGYLLRNEGWGLLHKSSGQNGCSINGDRYAVDFLVHNPSGQGVDLLINSETENIPAWQLFPLPTVPDLTTWRAPFAMDFDPIPPPPPARVWIVSDARNNRVSAPASASAWFRALVDHSAEAIFRALRTAG
jgi:hypothetical protein